MNWYSFERGRKIGELEARQERIRQSGRLHITGHRADIDAGCCPVAQNEMMLPVPEDADLWHQTDADTGEQPEFHPDDADGAERSSSGAEGATTGIQYPARGCVCMGEKEGGTRRIPGSWW